MSLYIPVSIQEGSGWKVFKGAYPEIDFAAVQNEFFTNVRQEDELVISRPPIERLESAGVLRFFEEAWDIAYEQAGDLWTPNSVSIVQTPNNETKNRIDSRFKGTSFRLVMGGGALLSLYESEISSSAVEIELVPGDVLSLTGLDIGHSPHHNGADTDPRAWHSLATTDTPRQTMKVGYDGTMPKEKFAYADTYLTTV